MRIGWEGYMAGIAGGSLVLFKSCPRCSGDRILEQDFYGWYVVCLNCGHMTYPELKAEAARSIDESRRSA